MKTFLAAILLIAVMASTLVNPAFSQTAEGDLNHKLFMGYQGWFLTEGDSSAPNEWRHWFSSTTTPSAQNLNIDMWPDMREYTQTYATDMTYQDGSSARLFSSHDASTVMTHFRWMKEYNIHGVYLQRFLGEAVNDPRFFQVRNNVLQNVMNAADAHDRKFALMYDLSGVPDDGNLYNKLINDWEYLVQQYALTQDDNYLKQNGLPVVAIWGIGFDDRGLNPITFEQIINYFKNSAPPQYRAYVVGGVPSRWRTLNDDSESDPRWASVYRSLDMISPWTVGRYTNNSEVDNWKTQRIIPDVAEAQNHGVDYMPVIWPGFSWYNLHDGPLNQIPRNGGEFYWRQAYNALDAGAEFLYVAMFDEVDEATAMFKLAETQNDVPTQGNFVTLNADEQQLPSDWYLRLAGETQKMLDSTIPLSPNITISPNDPTGPEVGEPKNPIIRHIYTADPSAHVWSDGRLYVYASHDIAPPHGADLMDEYHVFSTDDMVNWTDHGEILRASDVPWGRPEGGFMWAPDAAYKDGTYYFYFPHPSDTEWNTSWKIGVATSTEPASGFTVQGYIPGLDPLIDPSVFIDDDSQAYFYHGGGGVCKGGKLKDNMMEIDGQMQDMQGLVDFHEAAWVHKRNGVYYLSYSDNHDVGDQHNRMRYATSNHPLGPWTYRGIYMDPTDSYTNHGSIVEYKGQWWAFYHNSSLSGHDWLRSVAVDKLFYNPDGTIQKVIQTKEHGTPYGGAPWNIPGVIEAEDYDEGGQAVSYSDSDTLNHGGAYRPGEAVDIGPTSDGGYHVGWLGGSEWLEYTVNVTQSGTYNLTLRVASEGGSNLRFYVDGTDATGSIAVPDTGTWQTYTSVQKQISLDAGEHIMQLRAGGAFNIDHLTFNLIGDSNQPPQASAGNDQQLPNTSTTAMLNGSGNDPDNDPLNFQWQQISGPNATLNNSTSATGSVSGLTAGNSYLFRLEVNDGQATASDDVTITVASAGNNQTPFGGNPLPIPGPIEMEHFDNGGQGVAYWDADSIDHGGQGRAGEGVDIEACSAGGHNIGWTNNGEWLEYTVNVVTAGAYDFEFRTASIFSGGSFHVEFDGVNKTGSIASINTGTWQTWGSVHVNNVNLAAGVQVMRIYLDSANYNLDKVIISSADSSDVAVTDVSLSPSSATLTVNNSQQFSASVIPTNATNPSLNWASTNPSVATVNSTGLVTAVATGTTTITVTTQDGGYTDSSNVVVEAAGNGATRYRIRNAWQNTYMFDAGAAVGYSTSPSGSSFEWELEDVGGGFQEIRNVATGDYIHIENLTGHAQCTDRTFGWYSSRWEVGDAGNGQMRFRNAWQSNNYLHVENLHGQVQHGTIYMEWASAKWVLEPVMADGA